MFAVGTLHITIKPDSERIEMNVFDYGVFKSCASHSIQTTKKGLGLMLTYNSNTEKFPSKVKLDWHSDNHIVSHFKQLASSEL